MFSAGEKLKSSKINWFGLRPELPWWVHKNGRTGVRARGYSVDSIFLLDRLESLDSISVSYTSVHRLALEKRILLPPQLLAAIAEQSAARINDIYCSSESASSRIGSFSCASVSYALW